MTISMHPFIDLDMGKYIDADRLRSEIEKRKQIHFNDYFVKKSGNPADYGASNALAQVLPLIDSLQQKQPEADLVAELKHHLATTPKEQLEKEWKELEPWNNIGPTVQEFLYGKQPEVDLEKFISDFIDKKDSENQGKWCEEDIIEAMKSSFALGLNARKI